MTALTIIGAGSHASMLHETAVASGWQFIFFADDDPDRGDSIRPEIETYLLGVNNSQDRMQLRCRLRAETTVPLVAHPTAIRPKDWYGYSPGSVLGAGSVIAARDVVIGAHTHVNVGATVSQGTRLGNFVTVAPGAHICGQVTIGDGSYIGAGAVVKQLVTIGKNVTVGCGAAVVNDIPDGKTVVGVPARPL